ncbi:MAG TPA: PHP domain-containing protein, partial [Chthoniobacterales bacterium]
MAGSPAKGGSVSADPRVDLHVHSRHSTRSADWLLRRFDFPSSYTDPLTLLARLREAGMRFVTITDHNTLAGCLEIAHLPDVFLSEEVTTHFPEDGSIVHLLVWGITESQHKDIQKLRENIYDLRGYLAGNGVAHAVAHLFHSPDEKLHAANLQKLILLFKHFEVVNGRYDGILSQSARHALEKLTPRRIEQFVARLGIEPTHEEPWKKIFVGGSDDHGGVFPARAFTRTPPAASVPEFLDHLRAGRCLAEGRNGTPLTLAHSTYSTAFQFIRGKMSANQEAPGTALIEKVFARFMEGKDPTEFSFAEKFGFLMQGLATGKIFELAKAGNSSLWKEMSAYFSRPEVKAALARETEGVKEPERRAFLMANLIANQLGFRFFSQFVAQITGGNLLESIQMISPLVPIAGILTPYFRAFSMPKRRTLRELSQAACGEIVPELRNVRRA